MHRTHAGHGSIWPAETSGKRTAELRNLVETLRNLVETLRIQAKAHAQEARPDLLDAAERLERQVRAKQQEIEEIAARAQENYERALAAERLASIHGSGGDA